MPDTEGRTLLNTSRLLVALPLFALFAYTVPFFAPGLNPLLVVPFIAVPFVSRALPDRRKVPFYFAVEMLFMLSVLFYAIGPTGGGAQQRGTEVYSAIMSAEFALPFIFGMEILRSREPFQAMSAFLLGTGITLDEVATVSYSQMHTVPVIAAYIDVWSLQLSGIASLFESGYQSGLPLQTMNIGISPEILFLLLLAVAGFFLFIMHAAGGVNSIRLEQTALHLAVGAAATIVVLSVSLAASGSGFAITVISVAVLAVFILVARTARRTMRTGA